MKKALATLCIPLILAGCATRPPGPVPGGSWPARRARLLALQTWKASGEFAIRSGGHGGQAWWHWSRSRGRERLLVLGPLGRVLFVVDRAAGGVTLRDSDGHTYHAAQAGTLIRHLTGWALPTRGLSYWILGVPRPDLPERHELDPEGRLVRLQQSGWTVDFVSYRTYRTYSLPHRITLSYAGRSAAQNVRLRLVVDQWQLH